MKRPPKNAVDTFDEAAPVYDEWVRKALPTYDEIFDVAVSAVPYPTDAAILVADLGAGTGLFADAISRRFPNARFELFDGSAEMLAKARQRFATDGKRFSTQLIDLEHFKADAAYQTIVSSLAIHHLEDDAKISLFRNVFAALEPGGAFINVDQVRGDPPFGDLYWNTWLERVRAAGAPEEQIQASIKRRREFDRDAGLDEQLSWLRDAGFEVDCLYKHYFLAVFLALKPAA